MKVNVPRNIANATGLDPNKEYTIDEVFEVVKDTPMGRAQGGLTKEGLAQILGGGPANRRTARLRAAAAARLQADGPKRPS